MLWGAMVRSPERELVPPTVAPVHGLATPLLRSGAVVA
jgi:hypothetical protein